MTKKVEQEEEAASYSMNDDDYLCSNDHNNIDNNTNLKHERRAWGTWEELLLACAVKRHGICDWDSVATEVRTRTSLFISADNCRQKYRDLQRRFKESTTADEAATAAEDDIPWLEELRSLRVAELRREVEQYDVSILSLQLKVKKLEEEERDGGGKLDLGEEERKGERSENDKAAEESERENRSMNESNSTGSGEKIAGGDERGKARGDDLDPDPVNTAGEGSGASDSGELGESGTSGRKWKRKRGKDSDGEIRSAASESQPLIRLLDLIRSHPRGSLFERRVRSQETTAYKSLVKQHLDIETIQRKLKQGCYDSSKLTFYRDLQLLFANVIVFFPSSSSESMAAHELRAIVSEEIRKETGKTGPRMIKQEESAGMTTSIKADAAETSEQKSSAPLVVCKRRRFVSAKAKASPSSSSFSQKEEETKEEAFSEENENVETGGRSSKRTTANNTKIGKGKNKQKQVEEKTEKKGVVASDKKKSVADFLKRIKTSSPQKEEKDQNKSKKESKPKPRELRSNNVGRKKKAEVENATPVKRAPGRPPQKKTVEAVATASGKRGRESGSTGKDNKQPKKRSKR
ncbi:hypothetical protein HA466_0073040 [Hirschfeldia incana]|nr:hypothetical protein HA466_0073040 [Hirschfeldia incana]